MDNPETFKSIIGYIKRVRESGLFLKGKTMNSNKDIEVMDFNNKEEQVEEYTQAPQWNVPNIEPERKTFWEKHRFGIGVLSGITAVVVVFAVVIMAMYAFISASGITLMIGGSNGPEVADSLLLDDESVEKLNELYSYMYLYYYEDYELEDIKESMYKGVMEGLDDPYSVYYTPQEYQDLQISTSGVYYGIGAGLSQDLKTMEVTISKVYKGTPAEEAGLLNGDKIIKVNDIEATSMELSDLVQHIRGEEGTIVHIQVYRASTEEMLEFDVERRNVVLPSIEGEMLEDGIGYIQITEFQEKTAMQFKTMVGELKTQGMKGLIVDVRANPGGYLSAVNDILDTVLPEGLLVYTEDKYGNRQEYSSDAACLEIPMVVLVDENSASASEIFAGAIKDYKWGTLIGTTTFGKGIVQNVIPLSDGDALKITTSKYFTPNGNYIHEVGIEPDIVVEYEYTGPLDQPYDKQYDNQFLKAVEVMKEKLQ